MTTPTSVLFVCTGNICRSPMGERMLKAYLREAGLEARVSSAGTSNEEQGSPIDWRAQRALAAAGYETAGHRAHRMDARELAAADLVIAAETHHASRVKALAPDAQVCLVSDFIPGVRPGTPLPDPWWGDAADFERTLAALERAMPGIVAWIRDRQAAELG